MSFNARALMVLALLAAVPPAYPGQLPPPPPFQGFATAAATPEAASAASSPTGTLGTFAMLNEAASQGNSVVDGYGVSNEGGNLVTYWLQGQNNIRVVGMGNNQYELQETIGGRCLTVSGTTVHTDTCSGSSAQLFALQAQSDGSYTVATSSGSCIMAPGPFATVAAQVCSSSASNQHWVFSGASPLNLGSGSGSGGGGGGNTPITNSPTVPANYHITFDDEFPSLSISDTDGAGTNWYTHTVQCCLYDTSNPSSPTYMAGITAPAGEDPYSLVSGGGVDIRLQKTNGSWYSGVLASVDKTGKGFAQQYGYFEVKAQFPAGLGTWPAFWLLNQNALTQGAAAGEIDVVESYMQFPTYINTTLHDWTPPATTPAYKQAQVANLSSGFHVFGMLWTKTTMTFYCDGATLYSVPTPSIMNQPYYVILDLGLGGGWPTNQTPSKNDMLVKYVRVYAPN